MPAVADLVRFLQRFAPTELAEEWDNVGLLVGDRKRLVQRVLTCLTLTPDVAAEAIADGVQLVVTHHPVPFRAIKRLTADDAQGQMLLELIAAGVAVYSPHTGYDSAAEGINQQLAELLGLVDVVPLRPAAAPTRCKIVCFVPRENLQAVQEALWSAGAGVIGEYSQCSFALDGTGSFLGSDAANPAVGQAGQFETVAEARLEVICPERQINEAVRRLREAHPYEEPAFDVYPLKPDALSVGTGRMGVFPATKGGGVATRQLSEVLSLVKQQLGISQLQYVGHPDRPVSRIGICCGSGGELLSAAIAAGCDAFLTGEARFHSCLEARSAGVALILAGHYATERPAMEHLAGVLSREFPEIAAHASRTERDPVQYG